MESLAMDSADKKILLELQKDSSLAISELADKVGMSPSACHRRIKLLEEKNIITGYAAKLSAKELGYRLVFIVEISLNSQSKDILEQFEKAVSRTPEILECHLMAGSADYIIKVASTGPEDFERIHRECLSSLPEVSRIHSSMILRTVREWSGYSIEQLR